MVLASNGWGDEILGRFLMTSGMAVLLGLAACLCACFRKATPAAILVGVVAFAFAVGGVLDSMDINRQSFLEWVQDRCQTPLLLAFTLAPLALGLVGAAIGAVRLLRRHGARE